MLDARKLARMGANRDRVREGRTRTVVCLIQAPTGPQYLAAQAAWQPQLTADPTAQPFQDAPIEVRAEFPLGVPVPDITLVADTADNSAAGWAAADKYEIISYRLAGITPNRYTVHLKRRR